MYLVVDTCFHSTEIQNQGSFYLYSFTHLNSPLNNSYSIAMIFFDQTFTMFRNHCSVFLCFSSPNSLFIFLLFPRPTGKLGTVQESPAQGSLQHWFCQSGCQSRHVPCGAMEGKPLWLRAASVLYHHPTHPWLSGDRGDWLLLHSQASSLLPYSLGENVINRKHESREENLVPLTNCRVTSFGDVQKLSLSKNSEWLRRIRTM